MTWIELQRTLVMLQRVRRPGRVLQHGAQREMGRRVLPGQRHRPLGQRPRLVQQHVAIQRPAHDGGVCQGVGQCRGSLHVTGLGLQRPVQRVTRDDVVGAVKFIMMPHGKLHQLVDIGIGRPGSRDTLAFVQ